MEQEKFNEIITKISELAEEIHYETDPEENAAELAIRNFANRTMTDAQALKILKQTHSNTDQ